ncbi:hypothetical protein ACOSP7_020042 [Xanthoceras sorbifolium]
MNALKKERDPESQKDLFVIKIILECRFHFRQGEVLEPGLPEESLRVATLLAAFRRTCSSFLKRCKESGNAEALFRQAMFEYFTLSKEHVEATYVWGIIILLCCGGENERRQALKLLTCLNNSFNKSRRQFRVIECWKRVRHMVSRLWVRNNNITRTCNCWSTQRMGRRLW